MQHFVNTHVGITCTHTCTYTYTHIYNDTYTYTHIHTHTSSVERERGDSQIVVVDEKRGTVGCKKPGPVSGGDMWDEHA